MVGTTPRPIPLRPAWLQGGNEYTIYVECQSDLVVLYPSGRKFPVDKLSHTPQHNPLVQAIRMQMARREAAVKSGGQPPRCNIRFLVHRDGEETYHMTYPRLDPLPATKTRQNLQPEDDVSLIVAR